MDVRTVFRENIKIGWQFLIFSGKKCMVDYIPMPNREIVFDEFILIDFFPYLKTYCYYANFSGTFIKWKLTEKQANLDNTVKAAYDMAINMAYGEIQVKDIMARTF
jgi:hypothetical protein